MGTLTLGGTLTASTFIPAPAGSEVWVSVSIPPNYPSGTYLQGQGSPRINVTGDPSVRMEVYTACGGAASCSTPISQWVFADTAGTLDPQGYASRSVAWPSVAYVRLFRAVGRDDVRELRADGDAPGVHGDGGDLQRDRRRLRRPGRRGLLPRSAARASRTAS